MANITPLSRVNTDRAEQMLEWLLSWSNFFAFIERRSGFELAATDFDLYPVDEDGSMQTRSLGDGYSRRSQVEPDRQPEDLGFHGDSVVIDRSHVADNNLNLRPIGAWIPSKLRMTYREWVKGMVNLVFNGAGTTGPREMLGLSNLLDGSNVPGYNVSMVIDATDFVDASVNSLDMSDPGHREAFRKALEQILPNYDNPGVVANRQLGSVISGIAQENTSYDTDQTDLWGRVETVFGYELIRVFDGVIPNDEPDNAGTPNNNTTSCYLLSPGEGRYSIATNSGLWVKDEIDDLDEDDIASGKVEWEFRGENAIQDKYSVVRIRNLKVAEGSETYGFYGV